MTLLKERGRSDGNDARAFLLSNACAVSKACQPLPNPSTEALRKTKASVVSTEALDFFALSALAHVSARARHSACSMEFGELGRVANLRDDPGVRPEIACGLLLDDPADRRRPKRDGVTRLCDGDVVLSPVLAEEQPFFVLE